MKDHGCMYLLDYDYDEPTTEDTEIPKDKEQLIVAACILERDLIRHKTTVLFLHHICTRSLKDAFGYASNLLHWVGSLYEGKPCDIFTVLPQDDTDVIPITYSDAHSNMENVMGVTKRVNTKGFFKWEGFK